MLAALAIFICNLLKLSTALLELAVLCHLVLQLHRLLPQLFLQADNFVASLSLEVLRPRQILVGTD